MFWNYLSSLLYSVRILFYYHGEIQAHEHIILRIIRESLNNNTVIALKQGKEKTTISAQYCLLLSKWLLGMVLVISVGTEKGRFPSGTVLMGIVRYMRA